MAQRRAPRRGLTTPMDAHGQAQVAEVRPITIAVVALGGEGGGVLADWIVDLAQHGGYLAQATAVLFGALAGSGTLPFARTAFEAAIRRGQVGVNSSLAAFAAGFEAAHSREAAAAAAASLEGGAPDASRAVRDLLDAAGRDFSGEARAVVMTAIPRLDDYQDTSYARHFLARLARLQGLDGH